jgi:hypothetical protein
VHAGPMDDRVRSITYWWWTTTTTTTRSLWMIPSLVSPSVLIVVVVHLSPCWPFWFPAPIKLKSMLGKCDQMKRKNDLCRENNKYMLDILTYAFFLGSCLFRWYGNQTKRVDVVVGCTQFFRDRELFFLESSAFKCE